MYYEGVSVNSGITISEDDAYDYAKENLYNEELDDFADFALDFIDNDERLKKEFVDWYFSGNWIVHNGWPD